MELTEQDWIRYWAFRRKLLEKKWDNQPAAWRAYMQRQWDSYYQPINVPESDATDPPSPPR